MTSLETSLAIGDIVKITAQSNNTFSPDSVTAREGDVLEFHFQARNHSVVAGDYKYPCYPAPMNTGFFSGFVDVASGEAGKVFRVALNNTDPLVFYSSQGDECSKGMVGIVNANDNHTLQNYRMRAGQLARGVTPGTSSYGGELADAKASGKSKSKDKDREDGKHNESHSGKDDESSGGKDEDICRGRSSGSVLKAPLLALTVMAGAMVAFAGL